MYKYVEEKTGVCFRSKNLREYVEDCSEVWLLFDSAQKLYREDCVDFWEDVVKQKNAKPFGEKTKVIVVVFASYYPTNENTSPVVLASQKRLGFSDLLMTEDEARALFKRRCMFPD